MKDISLCLHPTTVVLVDDQKDFIESIKYDLMQTVACKFFTNPSKALAFFKDTYQPSNFVEHASVAPESSGEYNVISLMNFDLERVRDEIFQAARFGEIAVALIDYAMPEMDGLQLSRQLRAVYPLLNVILLTGEADHDLAVEAFNEGIIDHFIKKSTPDLMDRIIEKVRKCEAQYFSHLSRPFTDRLYNPDAEEICFSRRLHEPQLIDVFRQLCDKHHIVEYYILDDYANYLLLDKDANPYWLALANEGDMQYYENEVNSAGESVPAAVAEAIRKREAMPFFYTETTLPTASQYRAYMQPVTKINGVNEHYYYAFVEGINAQGEWPSDRILSYQAYLHQHAQS